MEMMESELDDGLEHRRPALIFYMQLGGDIGNCFIRTQNMFSIFSYCLLLWPNGIRDVVNP